SSRARSSRRCTTRSASASRACSITRSDRWSSSSPARAKDGRASGRVDGDDEPRLVVAGLVDGIVLDGGGRPPRVEEEVQRNRPVAVGGGADDRITDGERDAARELDDQEL